MSEIQVFEWTQQYGGGGGGLYQLMDPNLPPLLTGCPTAYRNKQTITYTDYLINA